MPFPSVPAAVAFAAAVIRKTAVILLDWMLQPVADATIPDNLKLKRPIDQPTLPETPQDKLPPNPPYPPKAPPLPSNPYTNPLPSPNNVPFPTPPERKLPQNVDLKQKEHQVTSSVNETLNSRKYGCLLYVPVITTPYTVYNCDYSSIETTIQEDQPEALKRLFAWLMYKGDRTVEELRSIPLMDSLLNVIGITTSIEDLLVDKVCDLAYIGINYFTRGAGSSVIGKTAIIYGCQALLKLALSYTERNRAGVGSLTLITNAYTSITVVECPPGITPEIDNTLTDGMLPATPVNWEPDTVLLPDTAAFTNIGKFLILYWVLDKDPNYATYYTTWQIPMPIEELYDVFDGEGKLDGNKCKANWSTYFAPLHRTQGYQASRLYSVERKQPIAKGHFTDKGDAEQCFGNIERLTQLTVREKAPIVHSAATEEEYLKVLSHVGERMVLRKVNVVDKTPNEDSGKVLVS